jgi:hypothetical protein
MQSRRECECCTPVRLSEGSCGRHELVEASRDRVDSRCWDRAGRGRHAESAEGVCVCVGGWGEGSRKKSLFSFFSGAGGGLEDDTEEASKAERAEAACDMKLQ